MNTYISKIHQHSKYKSKTGVVGSVLRWQVWEKKKPWIIEFIQIEKAYFLGDISKRSLLKIRVAERRSLSVSDVSSTCENPLSLTL